MRCFRIKCRRVKDKKVEKSRDYIGIESLIKYGKDTYKRYDNTGQKFYFSDLYETYAELYEKIKGKWVLLSDDEVKKIFELGIPYPYDSKNVPLPSAEVYLEVDNSISFYDMSHKGIFDQVTKAMIGFTQLHLIQQKKEILNFITEYHQENGVIPDNIDSVYPLTNVQ